MKGDVEMFNPFLLFAKLKETVISKENIRKVEWTVFYFSGIAVAALLVILFAAGMMFLGNLAKIIFAIAYAVLVYVLLIKELAPKVIRWVEPLKAGLLIDKFTGRTRELKTEGFALTLPTDKIKEWSVAVQNISLDDLVYLTTDGSIKMKTDIFYKINHEKLREFFEVEEQFVAAVKTRIQELLQAEAGDRTTDEVVSEQRALSEQLATEMKKSDIAIKVGRFKLHQKKMNDLKAEIKKLTEKLEPMEKGKKERDDRTDLQRTNLKIKIIEIKNEIAEKKLMLEKRLNSATELLINIVATLKTIAEKEKVAFDQDLEVTLYRTQIEEYLRELEELSYYSEEDICVLPSATKAVSVTEVEKERETDKHAVNLLQKLCQDIILIKNSFLLLKGKEGDYSPEKSVLEEEFHINITAVRLYNPELDNDSKKARDGKVTMKYKQEAVLTEYLTTRKAMEIIKEKFPNLTDKECLEYVMANRDKMKRSREEKVYEIPGLKDAIIAVAGQFFKKS